MTGALARTVTPAPVAPAPVGSASVGPVPVGPVPVAPVPVGRVPVAPVSVGPVPVGPVPVGPVPVAPVPIGSVSVGPVSVPPVPVPCTLLLGNPRPASRTARVARAAVAALADRLAAAGRPLAGPSTVDLAELAPVLLGPPTDRVAAAVATVRSSRLLVVASPTYKAAYTGLLKVFLDGLPRDALAGVVAVPLMTSASPAHRAAVELQLRPLLVELGATVPVPGLSVLEAHFGDLDAVLGPWAAGATGALARSLTP